MILDKIKNYFIKSKVCLMSNEEKMKQILRLSNGEITLENIEYLHLHGGNNGFRPDEIYVFISKFMDENRGWEKLNIINKGIWTSGRIDSFDLIIKDGFCTIEKVIKPY